MVFENGFWSDELWFATNASGYQATWKDLENRPGAPGYLPYVHDLHWSLGFGVIVLLIRYIINRVIVFPLGYYLGVSKKKRVKVKPHPVLEKAFKRSKKLDDSTLQTLRKQTDMTTRQIEIWYRDRRRQHLSSPIEKFADCCLHLIFYAIAFLYGLYVLWDKFWLWDITRVWENWPKQYVDDDIYHYYVVELAFYWSLIFTLFTDHKRKDFTEMIIHHIATMTLMYFSWMMNFVRAGTLVLLLHDAADPFLAFAKICVYMKKDAVTDVAFGIFLLVWTVTRLIIYPFWILHSTTILPYTSKVMVKTFFAYWFLNVFLFLLMILHLMWSYSIYKIVFKKLFMNKGIEDTRSNTDDSSDDESDKKPISNGAKNGDAGTHLNGTNGKHH